MDRKHSEAVNSSDVPPSGTSEDQIKWFPLEKLCLHQILTSTPELPEASAEFQALLNDIRDRGVDNPLLVTESGEILDGKHRHKAAMRLGVESLPCVIRDAGDARTIVVQSLVQRRHYSKGALAFAVLPYFEQMRMEALRRRDRVHCKNLGIPDSDCSDSPVVPLSGTTGDGLENSINSWGNKGRRTSEVIAEYIGVGTTVVKDAQALHDALMDLRSKHDDTAKALEWTREIEEKLYSGHYGLGGAMTDLAGKRATKGKHRAPVDRGRGPAGLLCRAFEDGRKRWGYWSQIDTHERNAVLRKAEEWIREMPDDLRGELFRRMNEIRRAKLAEAKEVA